MDIKLNEAFQDGPDFYREGRDGDLATLIVSYPEMVKDDYDTDGATEARKRFVKEFPEFELIDPFRR